MGKLFDFILLSIVKYVVKVFSFSNIFYEVACFHIPDHVDVIQKLSIEFEDIFIIVFLGQFISFMTYYYMDLEDYYYEF